jgi:hypothetical protein
MRADARRQDLDSAALSMWAPVATGITWLESAGYGPESLT